MYQTTLCVVISCHSTHLSFCLYRLVTMSYWIIEVTDFLVTLYVMSVHVAWQTVLCFAECTETDVKGEVHHQQESELEGYFYILYLVHLLHLLSVSSTWYIRVQCSISHGSSLQSICVSNVCIVFVCLYHCLYDMWYVIWHAHIGVCGCVAVIFYFSYVFFVVCFLHVFNLS